MRKWLYVLVTLFFVLFLIWPSQFKFQKSVVILKSSEEVFSYLVNLESWNDWGYWLKETSDMQFEFKGLPGIVGSQALWSNSENKTLQHTLISLEDPRRITTAFDHQNSTPMTGETQFLMTDLKPEEGRSVQLQWTIKGNFKTPFGSLLNPFAELLLGKIYQRALEQIKSQIENQAQTSPYTDKET